MRLKGFMVGALALALTVPAGTAAASSGDGATSAKRKKSSGRAFYATDRRSNLLSFRERDSRRFTSRKRMGCRAGSSFGASTSVRLPGTSTASARTAWSTG